MTSQGKGKPRPSRRQCAKCGSPYLIHFSSLKRKVCGECGMVNPWPLAEHEAPLVANNRKTTRIAPAYRRSGQHGNNQLDPGASLPDHGTY